MFTEKNTSNDIEFKAKKSFETKEEREKEAEKFINSLSVKPKIWKMTGSSARGDFRPDSDVDITVLYEKEEDIPYDEIFVRQDPNNDLIDGFIDFHSFGEDWIIYQQKPELLEELKKSLL
jgi:predicted nucleotidyltransferase